MKNKKNNISPLLLSRLGFTLLATGLIMVLGLASCHGHKGDANAWQ